MYQRALPVIMIAIFHCPLAWGGQLTTARAHIDEGNVVPLLEASSQRHVDAMRAIVSARYSGLHSARRWETIEAHVRDSAVARVEYRVVERGAMRIRTYHAIAGESLSRVAAHAFTGDTPPGTPSTPGSSAFPSADEWSDSDHEEDSTRQGVSDEDLAAGEAADDPFYTGFDDTELRAPFRPTRRSIMQPYWHDGRYHGLDAEQKVLRAIEDDILDGIVPRGGQVVGLLSSMVCHTCRRPIERMAEAYDLDIRLTEMSPSIPSPLRNALIDSGKARMKGLKLVDAQSGRALGAFDALAGARDAQVRRSLSPAAMDRATSGMDWQRRSFRLGAPRPRRITEGSSASDSPPHDDDAPALPPGC